MTNQSVPVHFLRHKNFASSSQGKENGKVSVKHRSKQRLTTALFWPYSFAAEHPLEKVNKALQYGQQELVTEDI